MDNKITVGHQENIDSFKKNPGVTFNNNRLYFVWADARNSGIGYDIYSSIFDYSSVVNVQQNGEREHLQYSLEQNYPNPFNASTYFGFRLANFGFVTLKVYDILGNEVATLVNENKQPGEYIIKFDGSNLASGIYMYQLRGGSFVDTKKLILLK